jgi:hypothetical protein
MTLLDLSPADFRRFLTVLVDRRLLGSQCCLSTGLVANGICLTKCCNALSSRSDATRGLPDLGKSYATRGLPDLGKSLMVWGCISHDCKLDLVTIQGI